MYRYLWYYYNYDKTSCINKIPGGYYLNDSIHKTIDKCNIKCKNCTYETIKNKNNLCTSCNNEEGYYKKEDDIINNNSFFDCYNNISLEGYFFNSAARIYQKCYNNCKICNESGDSNNNKCKECFSDYNLINNNCYKQCQYYYYFNSENQYNCTENNICPNEFKILIEELKKCVNNCGNDDFYKYEYYNKCYASCPEGSAHNDNNKCVCENLNNSYIDNISEGYYLNESNISTNDKCNIECKICSLGSNKYNSCIKCNNEEGYYEKEDDTKNWKSIC